MSTPQTPSTEASAVMATNRTMDMVVAVLLMIFGAVVATESWRLGARWTPDGPGAGYFPFYIGLIVAISGLGTLVQTARTAKADAETFVDREQLGRVLSVLLPALVYVFLTVFIGLYVASAIYIALFMLILGKYSVTKSVLTGVIVNVAFFALFEVWFKVPLYKGSLEPLRFLGY